MNSDQAHEALKAIELLMRLKLGQYQEIVYDLCDIGDPRKSSEISQADTLLRHAFDIIYKGKTPAMKKDTEWYRLYNIYQVLRKAIHDAEYPERKGVDAEEPMQLTQEPLPEMEWKNEE